jgi:hypothetical protein
MLHDEKNITIELTKLALIYYLITIERQIDTNFDIYITWTPLLDIITQLLNQLHIA